MPPHWANAREGHAIWPWVGLAATLPHPYKPLGFLVEPLLQQEEFFCLSTKRLGQIHISP